MFTSGATASLRLVGECFDYGSNGELCYLSDNHTSAVGIREYALSKDVPVKCINEEEFVDLTSQIISEYSPLTERFFFKWFKCRLACRVCIVQYGYVIISV